jgi:phosphonoacetate hydrolase
MTSLAPKAVICIFDGLRPDRVREDLTPNLWNFANQGVWYRECRSVFPSMTRVAGCSLATGSKPHTHGVVDNVFYLPPVFEDQPLDTAKFEDLSAAEDMNNGRFVQAEGLGCALARAGKTYAVVHSGSAGSAYMVNHRADKNRHWIFSVHGREHTKTPEAVDEMVARFGPLPEKEIPQFSEVGYAAKVFAEHVIPKRRPDVGLVWFVEPDTSYHYKQIGSDEAIGITRRVDRHFGEVLKSLRSQPGGEKTLVAVASDHGQLTVTQDFDLYQALNDAGFHAAAYPEPGVEVLATWGVSVALRLIKPDQNRLAQLAGFLMELEQTGMVLSQPSAPGKASVPGTISYDLVGLDHPRAPDLVWVARSFEGEDAYGLPGTGALSAAGKLPLGAGMHGGMSRIELNSMLAFGGAGVPQLGAVSDPADITDISPTILAAIGCPIPKSMTGHPLAAVMGQERPEPQLETVTASHNGFAQGVTLDKGGPHPVVLFGGRAL